MSVASCPSNAPPANAGRASARAGGSSEALARIRAVAGVTAEFAASDDQTRLASLSEYGGYRAKFPATVGNIIEAVIVNTGGGVAGGDRISLAVTAGTQTLVAVTSPSAERIYRSAADGLAAELTVKLAVQHGATLVWAPQGTLLFDGARLSRQLEANVTADARLLIAEVTMFGRRGSGESIQDGLLTDQWRIRRDGHLVFADATQLAGPISAHLARPAVAAGAGGVALAVVVASGVEQQLDAVLAAVTGVEGALVGVSAWEGLLVMRATAASLESLQACLRQVMHAVNLCPLPAVWRPQFQKRSRS